MKGNPIISGQSAVGEIWWNIMIWPDILILIHKRINLSLSLSLSLYALPTTKIAPENGWLDYEFPFGGKFGLFSGALAVSFREYNPIKNETAEFFGLEIRKSPPPPQKKKRKLILERVTHFPRKTYDYGRTGKNPLGFGGCWKLAPGVEVAFSGPALLADDLLQIFARWVVGCVDGILFNAKSGWKELNIFSKRWFHGDLPWSNV